MVKKITREEVEKFVKESLVTTDDKRLACGDGRYEPDQSRGAIRAFGADMGIIMAFAATLKDMGVSLPAAQIVEKYVMAKQDLFGEDVVLDYHCDSHSHEAGNIGCGHISKAANPENDGSYGSITSDDVKELFDAFTQNPKSHLTVLDGQHDEEGVIFVHGTSDKKANYSVNSRGKKGKMFFVVDADRTDEYIDRMTLLFSAGSALPIDPQDVKKNYSVQMNATAKLLKADQLPWYRVALNGNGHLTMEQLHQ